MCEKLHFPALRLKRQMCSGQRHSGQAPASSAAQPDGRASMGRYIGFSGNDTLAVETSAFPAIENNVFTGFGQGADRVTGGSLNDTFRVSVDEQKDTFDGGSGGEDLINYSPADRGVVIDLAGGHVYATFFRPVTVMLPPTSGSIGGTVTVMQPYQVTVADISHFDDATG